MRKAHKKQVKDFVKLLGQCHDEIEKAIREKRERIALDLLAQCQEGACQLVIMIEKLEGGIIPTIPLIKQYGKIICQIHDRVLQGETVSINQIHTELKNQLDRIEDSVKKNIQVRLEIVFLPYKASMWDSLESIWIAASQDKNCEARVIPIPYYDKKTDGSFGIEHYEGDLYPDYVPITNYASYNFEAQKPDVIFIHNPYDEYNYVTSVSPFFYSKSLKRFTEKLVYISYFILGEIDPGDNKAVEDIKHFCTAPALFYVDKAIVQSENMRQIYINVLSEKTGDSTVVRKYWESKLEGTGSPKFDKISEALPKERQIPENWLTYMRKKNGQLKKVILYNTGLTTILQHGEEYLRKIQDVFEIFYHYREEITLLWRPHPLLEVTLSSMRPELCEQYKEIARSYKKQNWGIYDDTADLDRAIAVSDAYYGDGSSLVQLYEKTGKPVMIQNIKHTADDQFRRLRFIDFLDDGNNIWFCALYTNGLFRFNKISGETQAVCFWPAVTHHESYRALCMKDKKLYLAPLYADNLIIFDTFEQKLEQLPLKVDSEKYLRMPLDNKANFHNIYVFEKYVFLTPLSFGAIVRMDTESNEIQYFNDFVHLLLPLVHDRNKFWFSHSCVVDNKIYLPSSCACALIEFDMKTCTSVVYKLGENTLNCTMICHDGSDFWILDCNTKSAVIWNRKSGAVDHVALDSMEKYNYLIPYDNDILHIPCRGDLIYNRISRKDHKLVSTIKMQIEKNDRWSVSDVFEYNDAVLCVKVLNEKIFVFTSSRDSICVFDKTGKCIQEYIFEVRDEDYRQYIQSQSQRLELSAMEKRSKAIFSESLFEILPCYLTFLMKTCQKNQTDNRQTNEFGKHIYEKLKKEVLNG